jgi:curved DNA-binding protein CbpA
MRFEEPRLADEPKIPRVVVPASALSSLRLSAVEGFILSRIDGRAAENELASLTGLPEGQVRSTLEKLESLHVIARVTGPPAGPSGPMKTVSSSRPVTSPVSPSQAAPASPSQSVPRSPSQAAPVSPSLTAPPPVSGDRTSPPERGHTGAAVPQGAGTDGASGESFSVAKRVQRAMAAIPPDALELAEDVDLDPPLRLRVLATSAVLDSLDYYEILAVERAADKKTIKRSYFELASVFHPDRYFRKRLGSYKLKMETLFARATLAHDSLTNKEQRADYDTYLTDLDRTRGVEDLLRGAAEEAERDALRSAGRASLPDIPVEPNGSLRPTGGSDKVSGFFTASTASSSGSLRPSGPSMAPSPSVSPGAPRSGAPPPSEQAVSEQAKRDALAMRLLGNRTMSSRGMPRVVPTPTPASSPAMARGGEGGDALKRRYEERVELARRAQADKYLTLAREAEASKDVVGAATAYKVAISFLAEGDPNLAVANAGIAKADEVLSETYLRQALYEDRAEHWADAAKSWMRVIRGRPADARAYERAANALAKSKGDLHLAAQYAQRAVQIEPGNGDYKITLATVFIDAGLLLNARRELEAAAQILPRNATIQALLKRVHKAG